MAIHLRNCIFIHVPKTGGTWVTSILEELQLSIKGKCSNHNSPKLDDKPGFGFVRHPESWAVSWWCYRKKLAEDRGGEWDWRKNRRIDVCCQAEDFRTWIENIISHPGILKQHLEDFIGIYEGNDRFHIGKTETLREDLIGLLSKFGEEFDPDIILTKPKINTTTNQPSIPLDLINDFYESQKDYYEKYEYEQTRNVTDSSGQSE